MEEGAGLPETVREKKGEGGAGGGEEEPEVKLGRWL